MNNMLCGITWDGLSNSWALLLSGAIALLLMHRYRMSMRVVRYLIGDQSVTNAPILLNFSSTRLIIKSLLILVATVCICLALLKPRWGSTQEYVQQEGRDVLIALDISRSMLTRDCVPDRLACAKNKIMQLLGHLSCERIGLILFSGSAFVQCPLTTDYAAFKLFLDVVDVETIASGSTALDQALIQALRTYEACPNRRNKLLVILTDGEDFSHNLADIKKEAARVGMHIFVLGVGTTEGAPIPLYTQHGKQEGYQKDEHGSVVISRLHEDTMHSLVQEVGGYYHAITADDSDTIAIAQRIAAFEKEQLDDVQQISHHEQYPYFIAVALFCFLVEWFL